MRFSHKDTDSDSPTHMAEPSSQLASQSDQFPAINDQHLAFKFKCCIYAKLYKNL